VKRIVLAEDNPADVYLVREALTMSAPGGFDLTVVGDGEEALMLVERTQAAQPPDLIILDLNLPKNDGADVLRFIRENEHLRKVPVVVLTSSDSPRDRQMVERLGGNYYITKPSDLDTFLALGRRLIEIAHNPFGRTQAGAS
jgi:CheY-like chemotaxis protein